MSLNDTSGYIYLFATCRTIIPPSSEANIGKKTTHNNFYYKEAHFSLPGQVDFQIVKVMDITGICNCNVITQISKCNPFQKRNNHINITRCLVMHFCPTQPISHQPSLCCSDAQAILVPLLPACVYDSLSGFLISPCLSLCMVLCA